MNIKVIVAAIIVIVALAAGAFFFMGRNNSNTSQTANNPTSTQPTNVESSDIPEFVKAIQGSGSVKCTYNYEGAATTTYIKNGKVRYETNANGAISNGIVVDKTMYSWVNGQKTGFMMDLSSFAGNITPSPGQPSVKDVTSIRADLEAYKPNCMGETISDSMFEKPSGITFSDYSKMMQDVKSKMPANVTIPEGYQIPNQ